jgi:hypothetical protein
MLGGPRWLILPVVVLVLPLAVVSAADIDLRGGVGEREYSPKTVADLRPQYKLGVGHIDLDLRRLDLTSPATVNVKIGMGDARLRVPAGACVLTDADIGVGAVDIPDRAGQGFDVSVDRGVAGPRTLRVNADIGVGHHWIDNAGTCT